MFVQLFNQVRRVIKENGLGSKEQEYLVDWLGLLDVIKENGKSV